MLSWTNVCVAALVARGARSDALRGRLSDSALLESDADLLSELSHINGFEAPRLDKKCGAEFAHAGCDPTSATPCCEGGRCVASAQCVSGHEHSQHVCNAAAWDSPTPQERACDHCATPWQCTRRDRTASTLRVAEDAASLKALSGEALRETRVLLRFRGQVLRHAIDANPDDANEMKRLRLLAEQTTAKMELLFDPTKSAAELASSAAEDIEWLKRLGGDPKKLGAVLNALAEEAAMAVPKTERDTTGLSQVNTSRVDVYVPLVLNIAHSPSYACAPPFRPHSELGRPLSQSELGRIELGRPLWRTHSRNVRAL
jgi:hypothetical protein